jgi:ribonuclease R
MLPEDLSNGWCSLRPNEDRGCLFVELRIDRAGRKTGHRFGRGLMRSAARMTYEEVQVAEDAHEDLGLPLAHLYAAYRALLAARMERGALDLDLPERTVVLDEQGRVASVAPRPRLDSHRLIEEFMVLANVAAAEELERLHMPCMYRVHAPPSDEKLEALRGFLATLGISLPPGNQVHPRDFDRVLRRYAGTAESQLISEVMLRSQSQAAYSPDNIGHFGLALPRYAHFTSPIRRYADLVVHRALAERDDRRKSRSDIGQIVSTAEHISITERVAAEAEMDGAKMKKLEFFQRQLDTPDPQVFRAAIIDVRNYGLLVELPDALITGLVHVSSLTDDFYTFQPTQRRLLGRQSRKGFSIGDQVRVFVARVDVFKRQVDFAIANDSSKRQKTARPRR